VRKGTGDTWEINNAKKKIIRSAGGFSKEISLINSTFRPYGPFSSSKQAKKKEGKRRTATSVQHRGGQEKKQSLFLAQYSSKSLARSFEFFKILEKEAQDAEDSA